MKFEGIVPALLTPFDKDEEVNYDAAAALTDRLIGQGIGGLFVCGSTGEWWTLSQDERKQVLETVVQAAAGRTKIMVHVGSTSTRFATELARHAESIGADAVSALPPLGRPYDAAEVWGYFKDIGAASSLPLYLYHLPQVYGDTITMDRFLQAMDEIPTLAGAKFSSYRIDDLIHLRVKAQGRLNIISGCAEQLLSATACGADGSICTWYNIVPRLGRAIFDAVKAGDIARARELEETLVSFAMLALPKGVGSVKWLVGLRGIAAGAPRRPAVDRTPQENKDLLPRIEATGVMEWAI